MTSIVPRNTTTFTDTLPDSSDEIEAVVRHERKQLKASIEELGSVMREKVDIRTQFREHPLAAVGVGFAAGIALGVLSNRATNRRDSSPAYRNEESHSAHAARSNGTTSGTLGKFAAAMMAMVGPRVANFAEDTIRESLSRRRFSVPARNSHRDDH
jgi:ElaB/YqjD/DUF883 family membrane-anchored ribosome-binding protein